LTIIVTDIVAKRVTIAVQFNDICITCCGPASLEFRVDGLTVSVEAVSQTKAKLRILSERPVAIPRG
jgi:hypothetical protein